MADKSYQDIIREALEEPEVTENTSAGIIKEGDDEKDDKTMKRIFKIVLAVVIIVIILLLLTQCHKEPEDVPQTIKVPLDEIPAEVEVPDIEIDVEDGQDKNMGRYSVTIQDGGKEDDMSNTMGQGASVGE